MNRNVKTLIICAALVLLQGALFIGVQTAATGTPAFPLDDTYIHLQYAKQIAMGNYFQYQPDAEPSSGATSFLYVHVLALGYWIGFRGDLFLAWVYMIAFASITSLYYFLIQLGNTLNSRYVSAASVALVMSSGWLGWSFWSGMEVALFSALLTCSVWMVLQNEDQNPVTWQVLSLTALCRPEGALFLLLILMMKCVTVKNGKMRYSEFLNRLPFMGYLFCALGIILPPLVTLLTTGSQSGNGLTAKWLFYHPLMTWQEQMNRWILNLNELILFLCGVPTLMNSLWDFVLPGTFILSIIGGAILISDQKTRAVSLAVMIPLFLSVFFISTLEVWHLHGFRYIAPFIPLLYFLMALGMEKVVTVYFHQSVVVFYTIMAIFLTGSFSYFPMWLMRYAEHGTIIALKQTQAAKWLNQNLPANSKIAINDAGALAYYGDVPIYDMVGLVSNNTSISYRMGDAGTYENLTALPIEERPQYAVVFQSWFEEMSVIYDIFRQPLVTFPDPIDTGHSKRVFRINWNYAGKEETPRPYNVPDGWELRDQLDIVQLQSEQEHQYEFVVKGSAFPKVPVGLRRNFGYQNEIKALWPQIKDARPFLIPLLKRQGLIYNYDIVDSGRRIDGEERFVIHNLTPGSDVHLVMRTCEDLGKYAEYHYRMALYVNGAFLDEIEVAGSPWNWTEVQIPVSGKHIKDETIRIRMKNLGTEHFEYFMSFYYWAYQQPQSAHSLDKISTLK